MRDETLNVLIVDDEPGMLSGTSRALRNFTVDLADEAGGKVVFSLRTSGDGEQALRMVDEEPADIILLDYKLPGISGMDVLRELSERCPDTLPIMITAYATLETAVMATKRGAYDFLAKPFTPAEVKNVIAKASRHIVLARRARQLAEERKRVRFEFISVLAHELKSPLNAVEGYLNNMESRVLGDDISAYDNAIQRSLTRVEGMRKLIYDLLDLTRIESGEKLRHVKKVALKQVAESAIEGVLIDARKRSISIDLSSDDSVCMDADQGELEIIFNNLISNAVKYNKDGGKVDVSIEEQDGRIRIEVSDTGIGLTQEDAGRLFQDFVRIKNEKTRAILGSGLGLSIVKKLAGVYGGSVSVTTEPGRGSTFTVILGKG